MYSGPFIYKIVLSGDEKNRKIIKKTTAGKTANFSSPLTDTNLAKLYVLCLDKEIVYIGYTKQSLSNRLNSGLKANGKKGYYGYKWKQEEELDLCVFVFQDLFGECKEENKDYIQFIETVEAELAYKVRQETGKWPRFQNEIHFHNKQLRTASVKAEEIYNKIIIP